MVVVVRDSGWSEVEVNVEVEHAVDLERVSCLAPPRDQNNLETSPLSSTAENQHPLSPCTTSAS